VCCFVVVVVSAGLSSRNLGLIFKHWPLDIGGPFCLSVPPSWGTVAECKRPVD
jgi:hypothetical protein